MHGQHADPRTRGTQPLSHEYIHHPVLFQQQTGTIFQSQHQLPHLKMSLKDSAYTISNHCQQRVELYILNYVK